MSRVPFSAALLIALCAGPASAQTDGSFESLVKGGSIGAAWGMNLGMTGEEATCSGASACELLWLIAAPAVGAGTGLVLGARAAYRVDGMLAGYGWGFLAGFVGFGVWELAGDPADDNLEFLVRGASLGALVGVVVGAALAERKGLEQVAGLPEPIPLGVALRF